MEAVIMHFRQGRDHQYNNQMIISVEGYDKQKSRTLIGKHVVWTAPGKKKTRLKGKIKSLHGNSGSLRVYFEKGMPGQCLGQKIKIE